MNATDTCSSVRNVGELHRDLRDWNTKVKATGSFLVLRCKYKGYILINVLCHDPSHGGSYMAEGAFYIRIGLPPRVVSGDCLASFTD